MRWRLARRLELDETLARSAAPAWSLGMYVFNQDVPVDFYQVFAELLHNSTLHDKPGTITLFMDCATGVPHAAFTPAESDTARPVGRGSTAKSLFAQVVAAIDPRAISASLPTAMKHPGPGRWWWLCFCDGERPEGEQFLGVAVVEGATLRDAIGTAEALGIHPGGRVASIACTLYVPARPWRNRLLSREDVIAACKDMDATVA